MCCEEDNNVFDSILHFHVLLSLSASCPLPHAAPYFPPLPSSQTFHPMFSFSSPHHFSDGVLHCGQLYQTFPPLLVQRCHVQRTLLQFLYQIIFFLPFCWVFLLFFSPLLREAVNLLFLLVLFYCLYFFSLSKCFPLRFYFNFSFCFLNLLAKRGQRRGAHLFLS